MRTYSLLKLIAGKYNTHRIRVTSAKPLMQLLRRQRPQADTTFHIMNKIILIAFN